MPTYGYRCKKNGHEVETVQGINDAPLTRCEVCGAPVTRIFYPVGIVFKGPGFYKTDSRGNSPIPTAAAGSNSTSSDSGSSDSSSSDSGSGSTGKSEGKPGTKSEPKPDSTKAPKKDTKAAS